MSESNPSPSAELGYDPVPPAPVPPAERERTAGPGVTARVGGDHARRGYGWLEPVRTSFTPVELRERVRRMRKVVGIVLTVAIVLLLTAAARTAAHVREAKAPSAVAEISQQVAPKPVSEATAEPAPADTSGATISTAKSPSSGPTTKASETRRRKSEASRKAR